MSEEWKRVYAEVEILTDKHGIWVRPLDRSVEGIAISREAAALFKESPKTET